MFHSHTSPSTGTSQRSDDCSHFVELPCVLVQAEFFELETDGNLFKHLPNCSSASNVLFCFNIFADLIYSCLPIASSVALSLSLGLPLSCQRHSGLEADKQAEGLRTNNISHSVCLIGDQCDAAGGWCSPLSESLPSGTLTFTTNCHTLMPKLHLNHNPHILFEIVSSLLSSLSFSLHCFPVCVTLSDFAVDLT